MLARGEAARGPLGGPRVWDDCGAVLAGLLVIPRAGRAPRLVKILPEMCCVVGETRAITEEKYAYV